MSDSYKKSIKKLEKLEGDQEVYHEARDKLYTDFIEEIAEGKIKTKKEILEIAKMIKKVIQKDVGVWYA